MSVFLNNGLTGILAAQAGLQTTSNNVVNANTEGYVRQRVNLTQRSSLVSGGFSVGSGVAVASIDRIYDQLLAGQLQSAGTGQQRAAAFSNMALRLDSILGNPEIGIAQAMQSFFNSVENVNRDPTSSVNRQQMITEGDSLAQRFQQIGGQLDGLANEVSLRLSQSVTTINTFSAGLADLNDRIAESGSNPPANLLDEQDRLLNQLAEQIDITTIRQNNGTVNVLVGNGQPVVLGSQSFNLALLSDDFNGPRQQLAYQNGTQTIDISRKVSGGVVGGLMAFRSDVLDKSRAELGQLALGLSQGFNNQQAQGMDLNGNLGNAFFADVVPEVATSQSNTGTAAVSVTISNAADVEPKEYQLRYDGAAWQLTNSTTGAAVAMTGSGTALDPFVADGLDITVTAGAAAGDQFLIKPVSRAASNFGMAMSDGAEIAAASPVTSSVSLQNLSDASIALASVTDIGNANLLQPVNIVFDNPTTYRILDGGGTDLTGPLAYTSGADINFNGWTARITGSPAATDSFSVDPTGPGSGDNSNSQSLSTIPTTGFFAGGTLSIDDLGANIVTSVGSAALRSTQELTVQSALQAQAQFDVESLSGVNLEEEAINLLRFQEAFMASSKIIEVANSLFQTILFALR